MGQEKPIRLVSRQSTADLVEVAVQRGDEVLGWVYIQTTPIDEVEVFTGGRMSFLANTLTIEPEE